MDDELVLRLCMTAGGMLLRYGAETSRVEETISHLAISAGAIGEDIHSFVTPTGIFVSMTTSAGTVTQVRRVKSGSRLDLSKVTQINDLSRRFARGACSISDALLELERIDAAPPLYSPVVQAVAAAISSASFTVIFGGRDADFLLGAGAGLLARLSMDWVNRFAPRFFGVLSGALAGSMLAVATSEVGFTQHQGGIVIGAIVPLLPGLAVTNAIRDLLAGDLLAGVARGAEAIFTAAAIGIAVAVAIGVGATHSLG